jgi:hypothetical protein
MTTGGRGFPWRLVIAGLAVAVIAVTLLVPPPDAGTHSPGEQAGTVPAGDSIQSPAEVMRVPDTIRVKVLNGTETSGLASRTQSRLFSMSIDTVVILTPWDPADAPQKPFTETVIVSHLTDRSAARVIADCLGLADSNIVWEVDPTPAPFPATELPDVTVYIGDDMDQDSHDID